MSFAKNLMKKGPLWGVSFPTTGGTYVLDFDAPIFIHLLVAIFITLNLIAWPIVGLIVAVRIVI